MKGPRQFLREIAAGFRTSQLAILLAVLFFLDLFLLDPIPFIDEILLGLLGILVARWRGKEEMAEKPPMKDVTPGRS